MQYRREIDGLRALAVLPVMLFHAGISIFGGGFVGVDVFFVISGYLITSIIASDLDQERFSMIQFWERRARRILPALFVVVLASIGLAWWWMLPEEMLKLSKAMLSVSVFGSNVWFWISSGYFDTQAELNALLHTWSLSVEEQYYLLFPMLLVLLWRASSRVRSGVLLLLLLASLGLSIWTSMHKPVAGFYLLPARGWELLTGALIALHLTRKPQQDVPAYFSELAAWLGLALIAAAVFLFDKHSVWPGWRAGLPVAGTALVILFATAQTSAGRLLGQPGLVGIGLVSYSAYLWHQPLLALARHRSLHEPTPALLLGALALSLLLAWASWRWVEQPFRAAGRLTRKQIFVFALAGSASIAGLGLWGVQTQGFVSRGPQALRSMDMTFPKIDNGWCFYSVDSIFTLPQGPQGLSCWLGERNATRKVLLFGDSYAATYEPMWKRIAQDRGLGVHVVNTNWCHPSLGREYAGPASSRANAQCQLHRAYLNEHLGEYDLVVIAGAWGSIIDGESLKGVMKWLDASVRRANKLLILPVPEQYDANVTQLYRKSLLLGEALDWTALSRSKEPAALQANQQLAQWSKAHDNTLFLERSQLFDLDGRASVLDAKGQPLSLDGGHLSVGAAELAARNFMASPAYRFVP